MNKGILFFLGLLAGIMICILLFYFDFKFFEANCPDCNKQEVITSTIRDTVYIETVAKPKKIIAENDTNNDSLKKKIEKTVITQQTEIETSIYNSEFSFENNEQEEVVADKLLQTKTVKVKLHPADKKEEELPDTFFRFFELQQWSTPIKNRITYYRDQNMVKIKGMEIEKINVVFWNDEYYLEIGYRYYAIPETHNYIKLNVIQLPQ
jgi:hypothetical protein